MCFESLNAKGDIDRKYVLSKISLTSFVVRTTILNSNKIQGESEMMATKESLRVMEYDKENTVRVYLKLNKKHDADEHQIPMIEEFGEEYVVEVAFVGKFGEEGTGGTATGVARVDGVEQVEQKGKGVYHNI